MRTVTTREPEWDDEQRAHVLALLEVEALTHDACGGFLPDTTGEAADGRFEAELPVRCHKCTARAEAIAAYMTVDHAPHPEALLWPTMRRR